MAVLEKKMTWQEFRQLELAEDDNFIYELINGILMKRSSPSIQHQRASRRLTELLSVFLKANPIGEYFYTPTDVYLDELNGVVPDVSFVSKERAFLTENDDYIAGAPDLIIEIISPGNIKRDRVEKMQLYEKFAVREFWLVDPNNRTIEVYVMQDNTYTLHAFLEIEGKFTSTVLAGFELEVKEVFE